MSPSPPSCQIDIYVGLHVGMPFERAFMANHGEMAYGPEVYKGYAPNARSHEHSGPNRKGVVGIICIYGGVFLRACADVLIHAYLPFYLLAELNETRLWVVGFFLGAPALVRLVVARQWGKYVDGLRRPGSLFGTALLAYAIFFTLLPRLQNPMALVFAAAILAIFTSAFNPGTRGWLLRTYPQHGVRYLAMWHQWEAAGYLVSSVLMGWVVNTGHLDLVEIPTILSVPVAICALVMGFLPPTPEGTGGLHSLRSSGEGPVDSKQARILPHAAWGYLLASSLTWEIVATTFGVYYIGLLGGSLRLYGLLMGTATFVSLVVYGSLAEFCQDRGYHRVFQVASWGYTAMYLLMAYPSLSTASCGYLLPMGSVVRTAMNGLIARRVPKKRQAEAMGLMESVEAGSTAWGAILSGVIAHQEGLVFIPKLALVGSVLLHILAPRIDGRW